MPLQISDVILGELELSGPSTEEEIGMLRASSGVSFPPEYREFLAENGAVAGPGYHVAGLTHEDPDQPPMWHDVVGKTLRFRDRHGKVGDFEDLVAISGDGMDVIFYLKTKGNDLGKILALGPGVEKYVANNLSEFIAQIHAGELAY